MGEGLGWIGGYFHIGKGCGTLVGLDCQEMSVT